MLPGAHFGVGVVWASLALCCKETSSVTLLKQEEMVENDMEVSADGILITSKGKSGNGNWTRPESRCCSAKRKGLREARKEWGRGSGSQGGGGTGKGAANAHRGRRVRSEGPYVLAVG